MTHTARAYCSRLVVALLVCAGLGCAPEPPPGETLVFVDSAHEELARRFVAGLPAELAAQVVVSAEPVSAMAAETRGLRRIALEVDAAACAGCYRLDRSPGGVRVRGDAPLGIQYGVAHWLEAMGVRFFHPSRTFVPAILAQPADDVFGVDHAPDIEERGLQLHILHPIESYFDLWEPSEANFADAERTLQWIVCNRGNFVTYAALDNLRDEPTRLAWTEHTRRILASAHLRGLRVGLGMQLFGRASLQRAMVLVARDTEPPGPQIAASLDRLSDLPFDSFNLAFGEFFGAEPDAFLHVVQSIYDELHTRWPAAEVTASIHVGDFPNTRVTYRGEDQLYYFLLRYAERPITPWIHTVMYYTLFDDAGGAYNHTDFSEHRAYLFDEMQAGRRVGYHPETAYWIAFDNSLPLYLPLYIRSRFRDLEQIRAQGPGSGAVDSHVVFSSGWEWGYWQSDVAVLRMSYTLPSRHETLLEEMFAPLPHGAELAALANALAELQQEALIDQRLAAYLASTDATFPLLVAMGFWAQPRRPEITDVLAMSAEELDTFETSVVRPLQAHRDALRTLGATVPSVEGEPFSEELRDGFEIDVARTEFAAAIWAAALGAARGADVNALLEEAALVRQRASVIIARRHAALFDTDPATLIARRVVTAGLYDYGYLREPQTLCFYDRELAQLRNAVLGTSERVVSCVL